MSNADPNFIPGLWANAVDKKIQQELISRQREYERTQSRAANLNNMINSGLYGGGAQAVHAAPNVAMPGLHPFPPSPMSDHQRRMNDMVSRDPQMKETLTALCSLMGYEIQSSVIGSGLDLHPVEGVSVAWRVLSRKWQLYTAWMDSDSPTFDAFKLHFAKLSDAIAAKREKLLKEGKPLPAEPVDIEESIRRAYAQLNQYAQQASAGGFGNVIDQKAFQNAAMQAAYGKIPLGPITRR